MSEVINEYVVLFYWYSDDEQFYLPADFSSWFLRKQFWVLMSVFLLINQNLKVKLCSKNLLAPNEKFTHLGLIRSAVRTDDGRGCSSIIIPWPAFTMAIMRLTSQQQPSFIPPTFCSLPLLLISPPASFLFQPFSFFPPFLFLLIISSPSILLNLRSAFEKVDHSSVIQYLRTA